MSRTVQQCPFCHDWQLDYILDFEILDLIEQLLREHLNTECMGKPACGVKRIILEVPE
jgi:hypothetical protein